jgi:threonine dehydratase
MYCIFTIIFLIASATSTGSHAIGMAITAGLFGVADAIYYHAKQR